MPDLTDRPAYPVLRQHLAVLALNGTDPISALRTAINVRELDTADDPAAVLDWRLDHTGTHSAGTGPLPWTPGLPVNALDPDIAAPLAARERIVSALAQQISDTASHWTPDTAPAWARPLLGSDAALLADLAIWRAGLHIPDTDHRPTGPARYTAVERHHQQHMDARVHAALGDPSLPANRWAEVTNRIDTRISTDPTWPAVARKIDVAVRAGIDIPTLLTDAAAHRPLPDEMPAAALWARLEILDSDLTALDQDPDAADPTISGAVEQDNEPDRVAAAITNAVDAAAGTHTEYADSDNQIDEFEPYNHPERGPGYGLEW